jgi:hypothetical protein
MVRTIEDARIFVLKASGDVTQAALTSLQRQMHFVLGDVTRMQSCLSLTQCDP